MAAEEAAEIMAKAGKLGPRVDCTKEVDEKFIRAFCNALRRICDADPIEVTNAVRTILLSTSLEDWAREAYNWASGDVKRLFEESDVPLLKRVKKVNPDKMSTRMGAYACFIDGPNEEDGCFLYVGSATGPNGLQGRVKEHLNPRVTGSRKGVEGRFHRLLHDGLDRHQTWVCLFEVDDPAAEMDEEYRTHLRLLCVMFEPISSDWLNSWFDLDRCKHEVLPTDMTSWKGLNFAPPLAQVGFLKAAWTKTMSARRKARVEKEGRDAKRALMTPEEIRAELDTRNARWKAGQKAMDPDKKAALIKKNRKDRHRREAKEGRFHRILHDVSHKVGYICN